jgi:hypothetical protein
MTETPCAPTATLRAGRRSGRLHACSRFAVLAAILCGAGSAAAQGTAAADPDEAFYQRAATCAAAMQVDQLALVARIRAGAPDLRPELLRLTQLGFAYVGTAYLKGLRDPRGDQMLKAAQAEQKSWPAARHAALVSECRVEAEKVYGDASSMEQWFVDKKAGKRVDKFLADSNPAASAGR